MNAAVTCIKTLHGIVTLVFKTAAIKHKLSDCRAEAKPY